MLTTVVASLLLSAAPMEDDQLPATYLLGVNPHTTSGESLTGGHGGSSTLGRQSTGSVLGVDSVVNWSSYFYFPDFYHFQFSWSYTMVGNAPFGQGGDDCVGNTTSVKSPIVPVNIDLRNFDGTPRYVNGQRLFSDGTQYVTPSLLSPVYSNTSYDSSQRPTQFTDAVQRAEFFKTSSDDWHTILKPSVKKAQTMVLVRGTYRFALNSDGSCCLYVLVDYGTFVTALFPATPGDTTTVIGAAENAGDITTRDVSTFLFPNTYLYFNGNPNDCCVLGFHTYDVEPGDKGNGWRERRYVLAYASWISPGLFGGGFQDVTALSHELAETFNDPFVNNATPWWLAPNGNCQNNLETGDVIEGLTNAVFPITLNGFTYHPQNEALLQWFAGQTPSSAIHHAYSYPDITVLPKAAIAQPVNCNPPQL
jgi:hypothetical protein